MQQLLWLSFKRRRNTVASAKGAAALTSNWVVVCGMPNEPGVPSAYRSSPLPPSPPSAPAPPLSKTMIGAMQDMSVSEASRFGAIDAGDAGSRSAQSAQRVCEASETQRGLRCVLWKLLIANPAPGTVLLKLV